MKYTVLNYCFTCRIDFFTIQHTEYLMALLTMDICKGEQGLSVWVADSPLTGAMISQHQKKQQALIG